jgi:hypothetical protein
VGGALHEPAVLVEHHDLVGGDDGRQPVRDLQDAREPRRLPRLGVGGADADVGGERVVAPLGLPVPARRTGVARQARLQGGEDGPTTPSSGYGAVASPPGAVFSLSLRKAVGVCPV